MTSKKRRKLSYHRILKSTIYLIYHLVKLTSRYFMAEWEPQRTNPGQSFLHSTLIALAYHTHTHTRVCQVVLVGKKLTTKSGNRAIRV